MPIENSSSPGNFKAALAKNKKVLVLYYWKDCGYCKSFFPIWSQVVQNYADKLHIVQIEWDVIKRMNINDRITSFPTIAAFKNGQLVSYMSSKRNDKNLEKFISTTFFPKQPKKA
jgi:thioredoxin 2